MDSNNKFRPYTLPKNRRYFWAVVQTFALPLSMPLSMIITYIFNQSPSFLDSGDYMLIGAFLWCVIVSIPYDINYYNQNKKYAGVPHRRMGAVFTFLAPVLYLRNIYLIIRQED
jgi:hypothetical protein